MIYISLCIPTNGISEWVFPVLDCIFQQNVNPSLFEVVVTDNGDIIAFKTKMREYSKKYNNLVYKETNAFLFENQIEALRIARGEYFKFVNHRSLLEDGSLIWMINLVKKYINEKPVMYLSNGTLGFSKPREFNSFDGFVDGLKICASWTTGVGVWKSDFEKIPRDWTYNKISPHSDVLFYERKRDKYVIDDFKWCHDIDNSHEKKGKYDLYKAFAVDEINITLGLYIDGDISSRTLKNVIKSYKQFVSDCYCSFNILKKPCSYSLDGFDDSMGIFMRKTDVIAFAILKIPRIIIRKILHIIKNFFCHD